MRMKTETTCFALAATVLMLLAGGGILMSPFDVDAAGAGTESDPYQGSASVNLTDGMEIWAYVGTDIEFSFSGRGASYGGYEGSGLAQSGHSLGGTLSTVGTYEIGFSPGGGSTGEWPFSFMLHVVSQFSELVFLSDPISDGVISYAQ